MPNRLDFGNGCELVMRSSSDGLSRPELNALHDGPLGQIEGLDLSVFTAKDNCIRALRKMAKRDHIEPDAWTETVTSLVEQTDEARGLIMAADLGHITLTEGGLAIRNPEVDRKNKKKHAPVDEPKYLFLAETVLIELGIPSDNKADHELYNPRGLKLSHLKDISFRLTFAEITETLEPDDEGYVESAVQPNRHRRSTDKPTAEEFIHHKRAHKASKKAEKKAMKKAAKQERRKKH